MTGTALNGSSLSMSNQAMRSHDNANSAGSNVYLSLKIAPIDTSLAVINYAQSDPLTNCNFITEATISDAINAASLC